MPDDFNMEADANQAAPLQEQAPQGTPDQLANIERQQRKAYWKGEQLAERRLPTFTPRDPLAGAALREGERIEEAVWQAEVEAQNMLEQAEEQKNLRATSSQQEMAQHALHMINQAGGELSPQALDDWVDFVAQEHPDIYDRPSYEKKGMFSTWLRDMEDIAEGREPGRREYRMPERSEHKKFMQTQEQHPLPVPANELPEGQEIG